MSERSLAPLFKMRAMRIRPRFLLLLASNFPLPPSGFAGTLYHAQMVETQRVVLPEDAPSTFKSTLYFYAIGVLG